METNSDKSAKPIVCGFSEERNAIKHSRSLRGQHNDDPTLSNLRALCLSGGGIRSATFSLGVINLFAKHDGALLRKVDYLSTVSGGGYLGSFIGRMFQSYRVKAGDANNAYGRLNKADSENLRYLRRNGRYLAQNGDEGLVALATFIRNTAWLHLLIIPLLMLLFTLAFLLRHCFVIYSYHEPFSWVLTLNQHIADQLFITRIPFDWLLCLTVFSLYLLSIPLYFLLAAKAKATLRTLAELQGKMLGLALVLAAFAFLCDLSLYIYHKADGSWLSAIAAFNSSVILLAYMVFPALNKLTERFRSAGITAGAIAVIALVTYLVLVGISAIAAFECWALWQINHFCYFLAVIALLLVINQKYDYINRTTLHAFYSARLRRAYLGAANPDRFEEQKNGDKPLVDYAKNDDRELADYKPDADGGPLHLINVTVNCTLSPHSNLWQPDRQGANLAVSAISSSTGGHIYCDKFTGSPTNVRRTLSLAQWVAISGAAASTGMGRLTSWYSSIITALLNVRLGYWWKPKTTLTERFYRSFYQEFSNRYHADINSALAVDEHWYLSDGGHFENLAAYEMIKRRVPRIMVLDAAQDKTFNFADLANLVRHARIDFHYDFTVAAQTQREEIFPQPQHSALIGDLADLKSSTEQPATKRACLLIGRYTGSDTAIQLNPDIYLLYIKPTLTGSEAIDITQYQADYPDFPHESTADQFFDEAQWESYRKLGYHTAEELEDVIRTFLS
jgi:hypothetical protein